MWLLHEASSGHIVYRCEISRAVNRARERGPCAIEYDLNFGLDLDKAAMEARRLLLGILCAVFLRFSLESVPRCDDVRKVFQLRQIGPIKWLPETPRAGSLTDNQKRSSRVLAY
nr:PREDICTED: uncharacterized protein LOC102357681 isoform X2 [Latimeria chalumnae]|eukprot:XP_014353425.1 PREDICTED: uncharacterized protein LOC102357681 isoform X2 [Latimeria chalumnae]